MALLITDECINCDLCAPVCPSHAIVEGEEIYSIKPPLCTECVGFEQKPRCVEVCPVNCIIKNPDCLEDRKTLLAKHYKIQSSSC